MLLVPSDIYTAHIKRARQEYWQGICPQHDSIPGRLTLCAKHDGAPGLRTWSIWTVGPGPTSFGLLGRLAGWWEPSLPKIVRSLDESQIEYRVMPHPALSLREAWIVGELQCRDIIVCAVAHGPELRRVWFHTIDATPDGLEPGVNRRSIKPGKATSRFSPDPKALVVPWEGGILTPLYAIATSEQTRMKGLKNV